jgi:cytochrome oxidase assembly protein ShyY1
VLRFLLRPRWLLFHVACVLAIVVMINLGFWQLRRLDERRTFNHAVSTRSTETPAPLAEVLPPGTDPASVEWRRVTATGSYDTAATVLVRDRPLDGRPGWQVLTPLRLPDGTALVIDRGWVPGDGDRGRPSFVPGPPSGDVSVVARLRVSQKRPTFAASDPATGTLTEIGTIDVPRLARQSPYPLAPMYAELTEQRPAVGAGGPVLLPMPQLDEGPHLSYAVQWFLFSACVPVGWVLVVRKSRGDRAKAARAARRAATEVAVPEGVPAGPQG